MKFFWSLLRRELITRRNLLVVGGKTAPFSSNMVAFKRSFALLVQRTLFAAALSRNSIADILLKT
jgi:hypothetical protein